MKLLTIDNTIFELDRIPDELDEDFRFSILDNSSPKDPDFFFIPLLYLETFSSPAIVLQIGNHEVMMPIDWYIAVGCSESGSDVEILPLSSINDRGFEAFLFNPVSGSRFEFKPIRVVNFYTEVKWHLPKTKNGQLLSIPITTPASPLCAFFTKGITKQCETIDYSKLI
jgi:hypothetical protein